MNYVKSIDFKLSMVLIVMIVLGYLVTFFVIDNADNKILFIIAYVALLVPVFFSMRERLEPKITKVEVVSASSADALEVKLNKIISKSKNKIVGISVINANKAFVTYKE